MSVYLSGGIALRENRPVDRFPWTSALQMFSNGRKTLGGWMGAERGIWSSAGWTTFCLTGWEGIMDILLNRVEIVVS
jgi:hypothetical protein